LQQCNESLKIISACEGDSAESIQPCNHNWRPGRIATCRWEPVQSSVRVRTQHSIRRHKRTF